MKKYHIVISEIDTEKQFTNEIVNNEVKNFILAGECSEEDKEGKIMEVLCNVSLTEIAELIGNCRELRRASQLFRILELTHNEHVAEESEAKLLGRLIDGILGGEQ